MDVTTRRLRRSVATLALTLCACQALAADKAPVPTLDNGYRQLYNLDFPGAQHQFSAWERQNPGNPLGPASEAAGLLFSEFQRLGILEAQFYESDSAFKARKRISPDPAVRSRFDAALERAEEMARFRLARDAKDQDALFALTLSSGLKADYTALVEKRNFASLRYTKESSAWARQLLAVHPQYYDAHLSLGIAKYIIGSMAAPVRWFARLGGARGDKQEGIEELQLTATRGRYLAPFARILLAIAYVRGKDKPRARETLASLRAEFPGNPLFAHEIARLDGMP